MKTHLLNRTLMSATAILALGAAPALAEMVHYSADLTAAAAGTDSAGMGMLDGELDTDNNTFSWTISYEGLSGPVTAAHFHGPASEGENAPPVVPIDGDLTSPITGNVQLTDAQVTQLNDAMWYFNIHTEMYPDGEIRGQVMEGMRSDDEMASPGTTDNVMSDDDDDNDDGAMSDDSDDDGTGASVDVDAGADVSAGGTDASVDADAGVTVNAN
ncbi:CHRD domain-containing protein [Devosia sp.]|uniref:CHRD domain-containing protein n=1 Tax=Devosia sp. TaxID=1871048 RepID=UPI003A8FFC75